MADENDVNEDGGEEKGKKKGIPTVVIIAAVAVLMMAAGVFVGKMMFGGGDVVKDDKTEVVKKKDGKDIKDSEKKDSEGEENKDGEKTNEDGENNQEENGEDIEVDGEKKGDGKKAEDGNEGESGDGVKKTKKKEAKGNLKLEEFLINLNDPLVRRYVKFVINLRLSKASYVDDIKEDENIIPEIRDKIFELVADKSYTDLKSSAGKVMLKEELMISLNEILNDTLKVEPIIKVMFSKYILQ